MVGNGPLHSRHCRRRLRRRVRAPLVLPTPGDRHIVDTGEHAAATAAPRRPCQGIRRQRHVMGPTMPSRSADENPQRACTRFTAAMVACP
ncbi:hypothetical protein MBT84_09295 [Streptomyces sp. MBT84]|nr:hypothetical protein [Streptomyces sp. MBT84]